MALMGFNLDEVNAFIAQTDKVRENINLKEEYRRDILDHGPTYDAIKKYLLNFTSYLQYSFEANCNNFYRVRWSEGEQPYSSVKDLKYPEPSPEHKDRMNNTSFRVLYTSLHEFTAMAESRIGNDFIGKRFQLTKFSTPKPLKIYRLGLFSELYLNSPRDSELVRNKAAELLGNGDHDRTLQGYSALEIAMLAILYDQREDYHILSSILADAIFSTGTDIEAIVYPSMQNRYGINVAFKKESADALKISYSSMNKVTEVHKNGFFKYLTEMECLDFSAPDNLTYRPVKNTAIYR